MAGLSEPQCGAVGLGSRSSATGCGWLLEVGVEERDERLGGFDRPT